MIDKDHASVPRRPAALTLPPQALPVARAGTPGGSSPAGGVEADNWLDDIGKGVGIVKDIGGVLGSLGI